MRYPVLAALVLAAVDLSYAVLINTDRWRGPGGGFPKLLSPCYPNPCLNRGTCIDLSTLFRTFTNEAGFLCKCRPNFRGDRCEIYIREPAQIVEISSKVRVNPGDDVELICKTIGFPTPKITWRRGNTIIENTRTTPIRGGGSTLSLCDAGCFDTGLYTCVADNDVGVDTASTEVTLRPEAFETDFAGDVGAAECAQHAKEEVLEAITKTLAYYENHPDPTAPEDLWRKHHWPSAETTVASTKRDAFELAISALSLLSRPVDPPKTLPVCPAKSESCENLLLFRGFCYSFFTEKVDFDGAIEACRLRSSMLTELDSREQLDYLREVIAANSTLDQTENEFWVAAQKPELIGNLTDGWTFNFTKREIPPDNTFWFQGTEHIAPNENNEPNCGRLTNVAGQFYNLDDNPCTNLFGYICRKPTAFNRLNFLLSPKAQRLVSEITGCREREEPTNCDKCKMLNYRTFDGQCNNLAHPLWGAAGTPFARITAARYEDGLCQPQGWNQNLTLYNGYALPNARLVANELAGTLDSEIERDTKNSYLMMEWAQFLDHDITLAPMSPSMMTFENPPRNCSDVEENVQPCFPIFIPEDDSRRDPEGRNQRFIPFVRSAGICGSGSVGGALGCLSPREQVNELTAFIDGSMVYGSNEEVANELRNETHPYLLAVNTNAFVTDPLKSNILGEMPPFNERVEVDCARPLNSSRLAAEGAPIDCFACGDIRCNEQIFLLTMHVVWFREHNRVARFLHELNPHWDDEKVFQTARKIVYAQIEKITFDDYLPIVLGKFGTSIIGEYQGYDPKENPSIINSFATAAFRYGHTMVNPAFSRLREDLTNVAEGPLRLRDAFFAAFRVYETGIDPLLRGLYAVPHKLVTPSQVMNDELQNELFSLAFERKTGLDLAALNIQRGRDHGLPSYNEVRDFCGLGLAETFGDLRNEIRNGSIRSRLNYVYKHPSNIDLWIGGVLEDTLKDGKVGPTFACSIANQLRKIRNGDRFWYENPGVFTPGQLAQLKLSSLSRIICDNGDNIKEIQKDAFDLIESRDDFVPCDEIHGPNLNVFKDCEECIEEPTSPVSADYTHSAVEI